MEKRIEILAIEQGDIDALEPKDKAYIKGFGNGFQVRVYPDGRKIARYRYIFGGIQRVLMLGDFRTDALDTILYEHFLAAVKVKRNESPAKERDDEKEKVKKEAAQERIKKGAVTIADICDRFLEDFKGARGKKAKKPKDSTMYNYRVQINNFIKPKFGLYPADDLTESVVINALKKKKTGKGVQVTRLQATISLVFNWAVNQKLMQANPIANSEIQGDEEHERQRALDFDIEIQEIIDIGEIRTFWAGIDEMHNPLHSIALKMMLLNATRNSETLKAKWNHFKVPGKWIIPSENTKNGIIQKLPILPKMQGLLDELKQVHKDAGIESEYLFPSSKGKPITNTTLGDALGKFLARKNSPLHDMEHFTAHDLRRTVAQHLGSLGFLKAEIGLVLNHKTGDGAAPVTSTYVTVTPEVRMKKLVVAWHTRLDSILTGKKPEKVVNNA